MHKCERLYLYNPTRVEIDRPTVRVRALKKQADGTYMLIAHASACPCPCNRTHARQLTDQVTNSDKLRKEVTRDDESAWLPLRSSYSIPTSFCFILSAHKASVFVLLSLC